MSARLPEVSAQRSDETPVAYGLRVLQFVLTERVTATIESDALELADRAFPLSYGRDTLPSVVDALQDARALITGALRARKRLSERQLETPIGAPARTGLPPSQPAKLRPIIRPLAPAGAESDMF